MDDVEGPGARPELAELFSRSRRADPYPGYAQLRESAPVWEPFPGLLVLSRHADCVRVLRDLRFGHLDERAVRRGRRGSGPGAVVDADRGLVRSFLMRNPPDHTRLRRLVARSFTPRRVEGLAPRIEALAGELLGRSGGRSSFDVIAGLASPLPVAVISELLGVPEKDRPRLVAWSHALARGLDPAFLVTTEERQAQLSARDELAAYLVEEIGRRRRSPGDDLVSDLVAMHDRGEPLSEAELVATCTLLLVAGHETTTSLIGNAVHALAQNPDQLDVLSREPSLLPAVVEEVLRFDSPVQLTGRVALEDAEAGGVSTPRGTFLVLLIAAANRDPLAFDAPDRFDVRRASSSHLAFGQGIHFCLGAPLARLEAQIALRALVGAFGTFRLAGEPRWKDNAVLRGLARLEMEVGR